MIIPHIFFYLDFFSLFLLSSAPTELKMSQQTNRTIACAAREQTNVYQMTRFIAKLFA